MFSHLHVCILAHPDIDVTSVGIADWSVTFQFVLSNTHSRLRRKNCPLYSCLCWPRLVIRYVDVVEFTRVKCGLMAPHCYGRCERVWVYMSLMIGLVSVCVFHGRRDRPSVLWFPWRLKESRRTNTRLGVLITSLYMLLFKCLLIV